MAEIRLSKLTKQFSIGLARLVDFLNEKGANVEMNPNAKVSDEYLPAIEAKFGEDLKLKKDSEKVTIKLKEIIEMGSKKKAPQEEEQIEKEVVIKTNTLNTKTPAVQPKEEPVAVQQAPAEEEKQEQKQEGGLKIVDKIDLSQFDKKPVKAEAAEPVEAEAEEEAAPVPTPAEEPDPIAPEPETSEPEKEPEVVAEPENPKEPRQVKIEVERLSGPKVVDKIDLSQFDKKKKKKRERIGKEGSQKVDVTKVEASNGPKKDRNKGGSQQAQQQNQNGKNNKKNRRDRGGDKFKPAMTEAEQEEMQKEIQKQIKETYARMNEGKKSNFGAKHRKEKREVQGGL